MQALRARGWLRRLPWLFVFGAVLFQAAFVVVMIRTGRTGFVVAGNGASFTAFAGRSRGWTAADLEALSAEAPGARSGLAADLLERVSEWGGPDSLQVEAEWDAPKGVQLIVRETGWPMRWRNENITRDTEDVFADQHDIDREMREAPEDYGRQPAWSPSWRTSTDVRIVGPVSHRLLRIHTAWVMLVLGVVMLALVVRSAWRRMGRAREPWTSAASLVIAAAIGGGVAWWASGQTRERFSVLPQDVVTRTMTPIGLTVGDLRSLAERPDGDRAAAEAILRALPPPAEPGHVLLHRMVESAPVSTWWAEVGWPQRLMTLMHAWRADPASGERLPLEARAPAMLRVETGSLVMTTPVGPGTRHVYVVALDLGELSLVVLVVGLGWWVLRAGVQGWLHVRHRRLVGRGRCGACGYVLDAARG